MNKKKILINKKISLAPTLLEKLSNAQLATEEERIGKVISINDGVAWISGLDDAMYGELLHFKRDIYGLILNLEEERIGAIIFGDFETVSAGDVCRATGKLLEIGVGEDILGRIINPLGHPLDDKGSYEIDTFMPVEKIAPSILERKAITTPLLTGIKAIDAVIPIGRGQRELIIGDRGTGKTALTIDTIINQKDTDVLCIYVAIGQKRAKIAQVIEKLREHGVLEKSVIVVASASSPAAERYIAPFAGTSIGEYFMSKGKHVVVIYDDLTKHAWSYREISLLLERPSGREAYPGDVFYLHSRLLERACQLSDKNGAGSLTALPIIETQAGDVSAYIPTNVISITDGQIYLESDLFFAGIRPALNVGLSVSRIGGAAQTKAMKKVAGKLRLDLSQYYELATFAQFASDLDQSTKAKIDRGKRIVEILKQPQYKPVKMEEEVVVIYLAVNGILDDIPLEQVRSFESEFIIHLRDTQQNILTGIADKKEVTEEIDKNLKESAEKFKQEFKRKHLEQ